MRSRHLAGQRQRSVGLRDRGRGVRGGEHAAGRGARALQSLGGRGQRGDQLEGGERDEREYGQQRAVEMATVGGAHPEGQGTPAGQAGECGGEGEPDARRARALVGRRPQAAIRQGDSFHLLPGASHDRQLGRTLNEVDHSRAHLAPGRRLLRLLPPGQATREPGHHRGRDQEGHQQNCAGTGEEYPHDGDSARPDQAGHSEGLDDPEHDVLERVDIVDDPGHEVTAAKEGKAGRGDRLELTVDTDAEVGQHPKGGVVPDEPLAVAEEAAREPEDLYAHDGQGQGGLGGAQSRGEMSHAEVPINAIDAPMAPAPSKDACASRPRATPATPSVRPTVAGRSAAGS